LSGDFDNYRASSRVSSLAADPALTVQTNPAARSGLIHDLRPRLATILKDRSQSVQKELSARDASRPPPALGVRVVQRKAAAT